MLGAAEIEREGVEQLVGAEPDVAVRPDDDVGLETSPIALADLRVDAVAGDDQVGVGEVEIGIDLLLEHEFDAELFAAASGGC